MVQKYGAIFADAILIDDSKPVCDRFKELGGKKGI